MKLDDYLLLDSFNKMIPSGSKTIKIPGTIGRIASIDCNCPKNGSQHCTNNFCYDIEIDIANNRSTLVASTYKLRESRSYRVEFSLNDYKDFFILNAVVQTKTINSKFEILTTSNNIKRVILNNELWKGKGKSPAIPPHLRIIVNSAKNFVKAYRTGKLSKVHLNELLSHLGHTAKPLVADPVG